MLITELKSKEVIEGLITGKVFIINCHGCKEVHFPEEEAKALQKELESIGATVILNRDEDRTLTLDERISVLKQTKPDLCIAIHHDANTSSRPHGFGGFHSHGLRLGFHFLCAGKHGDAGHHAQDQNQGHNSRNDSFHVFHKIGLLLHFFLWYIISYLLQKIQSYYRKNYKKLQFCFCILCI